MHDLDDYPDAKPVPGLVVYRYDSPLFFANVEDFKRRALASLDTRPEPVEWFLLNPEANVQIDITAVDALDELREELTRRGVVFAMARVKQDLRDDLDAAGFVDRLGEDHVFMTLPTAVQARLGQGPTRMAADHAARYVDLGCTRCQVDARSAIRRMMSRSPPIRLT